MGGFNYKDIYIEDGKRVLEVNILPEKHCNFKALTFSRFIGICTYETIIM